MEYTAIVVWERKPGEKYTDRKYSRGHRWIFDGGLTVPASASPHVVPLPYSVAEYVDPEEAYIASLSGCHMLFFLDVASRQKFVVDKYTDNAVGVMEKTDDGKTAVTKVRLRPQVIFSGDNQPTSAALKEMHHRAHELCFIANSVKTKILIES